MTFYFFVQYFNIFSLKRLIMSTLNLPLEKLMCPICRGILIKPVTMPCSHVLCLECFDGSMEMANLTCPLCRKRVGGWLRTVKKLGKLVDIDLWNYIQGNFASYVETKQLGEDDAIEDVLEGTAPPPVQLSQPGEIRKEFETCKATLEHELRIRQEAELKASEELIKSMQEEENARLEREQEDERIARDLQAKLEQEEEMSMQTENSQTMVEELGTTVSFQLPDTNTFAGSRLIENKENKPSTSSTTPLLSRGPLDVFLRPLHGSSNTPQPEKIKGDSAENRCDSITQEILHFKPIKAVPLTPPKTLPDGRVVEIQLIRATPVKNVLQFHDSPLGNSPILAKQLATLQVERKTETAHQSRPVNLALDTSTSAFKGFHWHTTNVSGNINVQNKKLGSKGNIPSCTVTSRTVAQDGNELKTMSTNITEMDVDPIQVTNTVGVLETPDNAIHHSRRSTSLDPFCNDGSRHSDDEEADSPINNNQRVNRNKFHTEQEYQDFLFAKQLQQTFDTEVEPVNRQNGPTLSYQLRKRPGTVKSISKRKSTVARKKSLAQKLTTQPTLHEAFRRAVNKFSQ